MPSWQSCWEYEMKYEGTAPKQRLAAQVLSAVVSVENQWLEVGGGKYGRSSSPATWPSRLHPLLSKMFLGFVCVVLVFPTRL